MSVLQLVFSWPMLVFSLAATLAGLALRSWKVELAGAVAALPFMFYIFATPLGRGIAPLIMCAHFGCVYALYRRRPLLAAGLLLPLAALVAYIAMFGR